MNTYKIVSHILVLALAHFYREGLWAYPNLVFFCHRYPQSTRGHDEDPRLPLKTFCLILSRQESHIKCCAKTKESKTGISFYTQPRFEHIRHPAYDYHAASIFIVLHPFLPIMRRGSPPTPSFPRRASAGGAIASL